MRFKYLVSCAVMAGLLFSSSSQALPEMTQKRKIQVAVVGLASAIAWNARETIRQYWPEILATTVVAGVARHRHHSKAKGPSATNDSPRRPSQTDTSAQVPPQEDNPFLGDGGGSSGGDAPLAPGTRVTADSMIQDAERRLLPTGLLDDENMGDRQVTDAQPASSTATTQPPTPVGMNEGD